MPTAQLHVRSPGGARRWALARWSAFAALLPLLLWLVFRPESALLALWYVVIPVLPASFFLSTALWRGICPLATLNEMGNGLGRPRTPPPRVLLALSAGGLVLFHLMVPARHFGFNQNGPLLAGTVLAVGGLALLLGALFSVRSAFCNALCPVLPVELLYGQAPLLGIARARCASCSVCSPRGCLDLAEQKALPQLLGPARRSARWLLTPHGAFFAGLPGFIIGYNQVGDGPLAQAAQVYATTLGWSLIGGLAIAGFVVVLRLPARLVLPLIAALAGGLYYWYAGPAVARALGTPVEVGTGVRVLGIGVVGAWLVRTLVGALPAGDGNGG